MTTERKRHGCCDHTRILFNWLRYAEYLAAWDAVPMSDRPATRMERTQDGWRPIPNAR